MKTLRTFRLGCQRFTLVELLIVIAIISVLAAFLLPALNGAYSMAKATQCKGNLNQFGIAAGSYFNDNNAFFMPGHSSGFNDGLVALNKMAIYFNAKNSSGNYTFDSGTNDIATSQAIICPNSNTNKYFLNYGWNLSCLSSPNAGSIRSQALTGLYSRISKLPSHKIIFMADGGYTMLGGVGSVLSCYPGYYPTDSSYPIRYRHGLGNPFGHGGSRFNVLWSDMSVGDYGDITIGNIDLFR